MYQLVIPAIGEFPKLSIKDSEYQLIKTECNVLIEILAIEEKFDFILSNYFEYQEAILHASLVDCLYKINGTSSLYQTKRNLNRKILNLLTTTKLYLDQIPRNLASIDKIYADKKKSELFEKRKGDRNFLLLEVIRNHLQHFGVPLTTGFSMKSVNCKDCRIVMHYNTVSLKIGKLLIDPMATNELSGKVKLEEDIDLTQLIIEFFQDIAEIHDKIRFETNERYLGARICIESYFEKYYAIAREIQRGWQEILSVIKENEYGIKYEISKNAIMQIEELRSNNCNFENIKQRIVTNISSENMFRLQERDNIRGSI